MKGNVLGRTSWSDGVVSPKLAFLPKANLALASAMSFLVITPTTCKSYTDQHPRLDQQEMVELIRTPIQSMSPYL